MEGSTDRGMFGFGHKKDEDKPEQHGTHQSTQPGGQHQPVRHETEQHGTPPTTGTYSAAPGVPPPTEGEGKTQGFMGKVGDKLGIDKLKKGHKKGGADGSSSSSSDEEDTGEKKKKHGVF